jgi:hypothetical protein
MKAASITFIFLFSVFNLLAQPNLYPDMKLNDIDTVISQLRPADSIVFSPHVSGKSGNNPFLKIRKTHDGISSIVECSKYVYTSPVDSVPVERGEGVFDENGNFICSSRYAWDQNSGGDWRLIEKRENYYDASGRDTSCLVYQHNTQENQMVLIYKWAVKYNEGGNLISDKRYSYFMQSNTRIESTWEYNYNNQGSLLSTNHYFKDNEMLDKLKISTLEQIYDEHNNRTSREIYNRGQDNIWIGLEKTEWEYDSADRKVAELAYVWEEDDYNWSFARKSDYSYGNYEQLKTEIIYIFDSDINAWRLNRQIDFVYDLQGNRISKSCNEYDPFQKKWTGAYRFDYIFDDEGREISSIQYDWDVSIENWLPLWNKRMSYGSIAYLASYRWSIDLGDWVGDWKRETLFNMYGDYYLDAYYEWDVINSTWSVKSGVKWDRLYDVDDHEIEAIGYNWDKDVLNWVPGGKFEWIFNMGMDLIRSADYAWNPNQEDWNIYSKTFYNYRKGFVTGLPEDGQDKIRIYPNPSGSFLMIDGIEDQVSIDIFSTTGNLMLREVKSQGRIDISSFSHGIYIIIIRQAGEILLTKKVIKK